MLFHFPLGVYPAGIVFGAVSTDVYIFEDLPPAQRGVPVLSIQIKRFSSRLASGSVIGSIQLQITGVRNLSTNGEEAKFWAIESSRINSSAGNFRFDALSQHPFSPTWPCSASGQGSPLSWPKLVQESGQLHRFGRAGSLVRSSAAAFPATSILPFVFIASRRRVPQPQAVGTDSGGRLVLYIGPSKTVPFGLSGEESKIWSTARK